ncbi:hypothetical protein EUA93_04710 [Nocardioides oleivorans]|uniref:Uncharacterized protein n=1 Tax=Nocardioides oleivorans TaxID=273676 RepID=A0A4Q2RXG4_9ACTN|nr:hypothetical protein [Nocardioides oleivorans]RYB93718.1 hypothetical protein EUA93_04710 [Nocardioides oleivorans]
MGSHPDASGKRRSFSQRVGTKGENAFRTFADDMGLVPTKIEEDFGIDFIFQVDLDHRAPASDIANIFIGACVRATTSGKRRVKLTRVDALNLVNCRSPLIFILVHLREDGKRDVFHRVVDDAFAEELTSFIESKTPAKLTLNADDCLPSTEFLASLRTVVAPGFTEAVHLRLTHQRISASVPGANIVITKDANRQLTLVTAVNFFDYFEVSSEDAEKGVLEAAFGSEAHALDRIAQLSPKPEILPHLNTLPRPSVLAGFTEEADGVLRVTGKETVELNVVMRRIGTHFGWVHEAGFSFIISRSRPGPNGAMVHETELFIDPLVKCAMEDVPMEVRDFFGACDEEATLEVVGPKGERSPGPRFSVKEHFPAALVVATFFDAWNTCKSFTGWPTREVQLRDARNEEVFNTVGVLAALWSRPDSLAGWSFVLETSNDQVDPTSLRSTPVMAAAPFIARLASRTLVAYFNGSAEVLGEIDDPTGLRFAEVAWIEIDVFDELVPKVTLYPELVISPALPTVAFSPSGRVEGTVHPSLENVTLTWSPAD